MPRLILRRFCFRDWLPAALLFVGSVVSAAMPAPVFSPWDRGIAVRIPGHNPWKCLHQGVRVGPLKPNESRIIRGKLYVFQGTKEDCLTKFERDFGAARPSSEQRRNNGSP